MRIFQPTITGSFTVSGSVYFPTLVTSSVAVTNVVMFGANGELFTTASSAIGGGGNIDTGSLVTTASFNAYTGSNTSQFSGTASYSTTSNTSVISQTSSYATNFVIGSTLALNGTLTDSSTINSTIVGANNIFQQSTGSFTSAHGKYTAYKGVNSRAGEFVTSWNGTTTSYYDNSTVDIGNTTDITFQSSIVTSQFQINSTSLSSGWTIKMLVTYL